MPDKTGIEDILTIQYQYERAEEIEQGIQRSVK